MYDHMHTTQTASRSILALECTAIHQMLSNTYNAHGTQHAKRFAASGGCSEKTDKLAQQTR